MINIPKGTKDVLPNVSHKWQFIEGKLRELAELYNAREIRTPTFEFTELFNRSIGDQTDVVSKEMYTFIDRSGKSITLKPEGTASVARSYIENSLDSLSLPLKMYYITPCFRHENTQDGRLREFHQFGAEFYGATSVQLDCDAISLAYQALVGLGLRGITLRLNSIGCSNCRKRYIEELKRYYSAHIGSMCNTCKKRYEKNPLRLLDCKSDFCHNISLGAPKILDFICDDCQNHHEQLCKLLGECDIPYEIDSGIVRGLDYYTRTVFEFVTDQLGAQGTVCGGGRYDSLISSMGGKDVGCVGFACGLERIIMLMEKQGIDFGVKQLDVFIMSQRPEYADLCMKLIADLRTNGISADTEMTGRSLKAQFKYADKLNARYAIVVGETELASGIIKIKNLSDGKIEECEISQITERIKEIKNG